MRGRNDPSTSGCLNMLDGESVFPNNVANCFTRYLNRLSAPVKGTRRERRNHRRYKTCTLGRFDPCKVIDAIQWLDFKEKMTQKCVAIDERECERKGDEQWMSGGSRILSVRYLDGSFSQFCTIQRSKVYDTGPI